LVSSTSPVYLRLIDLNLKEEQLPEYNIDWTIKPKVPITEDSKRLGGT